MCIRDRVYGDGAFKDPVGKIWELADPVVSPAYTKGLEGQPNEVKLKYLADNDFAHLNGQACLLYTSTTARMIMVMTKAFTASVS